MSLLIPRLAIPEDIVAAMDVSARAYRPLRCLYRPTAEALAWKEVTGSDYERLVGECDDRIVATLEYRLTAECLHVRGLAVDPSYQGRGHARQMIDEVVHVAQSCGQSAVTLFTVKETGNVPFFEHLGFRVVSEEIATWCESDRFESLHEVKMKRQIP